MSEKTNKKARYLVPGFIFQSVMIGGGYGTGAEIARYFGVNGMVGGLLSALVTLVVWSILCAITFEFARIFKTYDYGSMMRQLLGKAAFLYDICYYLMMFIVLGVVNATAGSMFSSMTGLSSWIGVAIVSIGIILLVLHGTEAIEEALSFWSYVLYAVYILLVIAVFIKFGSNIRAEFAKFEIGSKWLSNGLIYSFYNLVMIPLVLYTVRDAGTREEAITCGVLSGIIGIIPGILLLLAMGCNMADVTAAETPITVIFKMLNMKWLYILFELVLFGTLIETGAGFIKAVDDRIEAAVIHDEGKLPAWIRPAVVIAMTMIGVVVSSLGLTRLIAKGYGTACYGFLILFAIPMVTVGIYKIRKTSK